MEKPFEIRKGGRHTCDVHMLYMIWDGEGLDSRTSAGDGQCTCNKKQRARKAREALFV